MGGWIPIISMLSVGRLLPFFVSHGNIDQRDDGDSDSESEHDDGDDESDDNESTQSTSKNPASLARVESDNGV